MKGLIKLLGLKPGVSLRLFSEILRSRKPFPSTFLPLQPAHSSPGFQARGFLRRRINVLFMAIFFFSMSASLCAEEDGSSLEKWFIKARANMVQNQIQARGVKDKRVLDVMLKVPRHRFVPVYLRLSAYADTPLPIGEGQTISQPYIVALMTELLGLDGNEKVLEIGTGSGYQAAVLAELSKEVYTIEILEPLARRSEALLKDLGYKNIKVKCGDGFFGWKEYAPFDAIIVTCAPDEVPQPLIEQLAEGGRMVIPVGERYQKLELITKEKGRLKTTNIIPVKFVPMVGEIQK